MKSTKTLNTRIGKLAFHHDFAKGYPTKETVEKLYDERDFQRACQAYLWGLPAVAFAQMQYGQSTFGAVNGVLAEDIHFDDKLGILTPNATTPYYLAFAELSAGPLVVELPAGVRGGTLDAWQRSLPDSEKPARYLIVGPGQKPPVDVAGFEVRQSPTVNLMMGLRLTTSDPKEAQAQLAKFRVYPYAQRDNPPPTKIVSPKGKKWPGIQERGMGYWKRLNEVIQREPVEERDRFFHEMLKPLGIEKGKRFAPNARQKRLLTEAALVGEVEQPGKLDERFALDHHILGVRANTLLESLAHRHRQRSAERPARRPRPPGDGRAATLCIGGVAATAGGTTPDTVATGDRRRRRTP